MRYKRVAEVLLDMWVRVLGVCRTSLLALIATAGSIAVKMCKTRGESALAASLRRPFEVYSGLYGYNQSWM